MLDILLYINAILHADVDMTSVRRAYECAEILFLRSNLLWTAAKRFIEQSAGGTSVNY